MDQDNVVKIEATKPRLIPIDELFKDAWNFFKQNKLAIWRIQSVPTAIILLPISLVFLSLTVIWTTNEKFRSMVMDLSSAFNPFDGRLSLSDVLGANYVLIIALVIIAYFGFFLVTAFFSLASYRSLFGLSNGTFVSYADEVRATFKTLHSIIWIGILVNLITRGGGLLLFIPGVIMSILTKFAFFENFSDRIDKRGLKAVIGSWKITKPYFFAFLGRMIVLTLVIGAVLVVPVVVCAVLAIALLAAYKASSMVSVTLIAVLIAAVILVIALGSMLIMQPFSVRYQWAIFNELKRIDAGITEAPEVKDRVYKRRKIIAIVLAILGLLTLIFNSYGRSPSREGTLGRGFRSSSVSIIERCDKVNGTKSDVDERCKNLLIKADIEGIASKSGAIGSKVFTPKNTAYKIDIVDGWNAQETPSGNNPDLNMAVVTPEAKAGAEDGEAYILIVSSQKPVQLKYKSHFVNPDGTPAEFSQRTFLEGVMKGAGTEQTTNKDSIYRIEDNVVSMTNMSDGYRDESWIFFTADDSFLISMTAPVDKWNDYRADLYKMALTFTPLPVYSTVK